MTEGKMRRFGLKLLIAIAMTIVLAVSIRLQWNSSRHRQLERQLTSIEGSDTSKDGGEGLQTTEDGYETGNTLERVDPTTEEDSENAKDVDENDEVSSTNEVDGNSTQRGEPAEDTLETREDELDTREHELGTREDELDTREDDFETEEDALETGEDAAETEENALETGEDATESEDDTTENNQDEDTEGDSLSNTLDDSETEFQDNSETEDLNSENRHELEHGPHASSENDDDAPRYEDNDPNWRAAKFSNALYDDEEENGAGDGNDNEDSDNKDDTRIIYTDLNDKANGGNVDQPLSDLKTIGNKADKAPSMFTWLPFAKYLPFGNSAESDEQEENEIYYDNNTHDDKQEDLETDRDSNLFANDSSLAESENNFGEEKVNASTQIWSNDSRTWADGQVGDIATEEETESRDTQINSNNIELPFNVNGIDKSNYDDLDDLSDKDSETQKDKPENGSQIEQRIESSLPETSHETSNLGIFTLEETNPEENDVLIQQNKEEETDQTKSPISEIRYDSIGLPGTQQNQNSIQPLHFQQQQEQQQQQQQLQTTQQLSPQQQVFLKALLPARVFDIIMAQNLEQSYLKQVPTKIQYFIHQNIHRIDQDFDPLAVNETKSTAGEQAQYPTFQTNGLLTAALRGLKNEEINQSDNYPTYNVGPDIAAEDYDNQNSLYEGDENRPDADDDTYFQKDVVEQDNIVTPVPETSVYDNPRPLSENQFALFRTRPYNTFPENADGISRGNGGDPYYESRDTFGEVGAFPQQPSRPGVGKEDETLVCPRDISLGKAVHPVTALVAFADDGTLWVRKIIEQLTGIETDSIYNIMAQLKMGNVASVYQMGRKVVIESHIASEKNFERAVVVIKNPFAVDVNHKTFRPLSVDWQKSALWNRTYSTWLTSSLPLHVMTYEDLIEKPLTELMKLVDFLSSPEMTISYKCAMKVALDPPYMIDDLQQITGIYHEDRRRIRQNIDHLIRVAQTTHPHIVDRLNSYKASEDTLNMN